MDSAQGAAAVVQDVQLWSDEGNTKRDCAHSLLLCPELHSNIEMLCSLRPHTLPSSSSCFSCSRCHPRPYFPNQKPSLPHTTSFPPRTHSNMFCSSRTHLPSHVSAHHTAGATLLPHIFTYTPFLLIPLHPSPIPNSIMWCCPRPIDLPLMQALESASSSAATAKTFFLRARATFATQSSLQCPSRCSASTYRVVWL